MSGVRDGFRDQVLVNELTQVLQAQGAGIPHVTVQRVITIPKTAAGKVTLIKAKRSIATTADDLGARLALPRA